MDCHVSLDLIEAILIQNHTALLHVPHYNQWHANSIMPWIITLDFFLTAASVTLLHDEFYLIAFSDTINPNDRSFKVIQYWNADNKNLNDLNDFAVNIASATLSHGGVYFDLGAFSTPEIAMVDQSQSHFACCSFNFGVETI